MGSLRRSALSQALAAVAVLAACRYLTEALRRFLFSDSAWLLACLPARLLAGWLACLIAFFALGLPALVCFCFRLLCFAVACCPVSLPHRALRNEAWEGKSA